MAVGLMSVRRVVRHAALVHHLAKPWVTAVAVAVALASGLVACSPQPPANRGQDATAVVACRQAAQRELQIPDVDGLGVAVAHVWVGDRTYGWYVEGQAAAIQDPAAAGFSCRVSRQGAALVVQTLVTGSCEQKPDGRRCGQLD